MSSMMSLNTRSTVRATRLTPVRQDTIAVSLPLGALAMGEGSVDQMRVMLGEAESVIRSQEARIRQLENLAMTDELTGLVNRRGLMLALRRELGAARRDKNACGLLIMVDLDGFKKINDEWGHAVGDNYLQCVASELMKEVRSTDIVARLGGDEFAILLTRTTADNGYNRLATLEKNFNSRVMHEHGHAIPLRASFGCASFVGGDNLETLMTTADMKLYAHKAQRQARKQ